MSSFAYAVPKTKDEALALLNELGPGGRVVAGCTNILPDIRAKKITACTLVDISRLAELKGINVRGEKVTIGSLTTINELLHSEIVANHGQVLWQAGQRFADPLVRNRATIGGNLANASPAADGVVPLLALDARVMVASLAGEREIPVDAFFTGPGKSVLQPNELITGVSFAKTTTMKSAFIKFGLRKAMAISLASIGLVVGLKGDKVDQVRIALGALAPTPLRARQTESYLAGNTLTPAVVARAQEIVRTEVKPISDVRASQEYRLHLTGVLLKRAFEAALA
ncbi:MAG: aerobic carbon-monoxide dehydrogenase medium subunit [Clostridia bacterium]|nr:aerobic carbon-monoxide dehydrogenase medium subunit [Clostridia bacterium]